MSLVSGPGRGGSLGSQNSDELELVVEKHVEYVQTLDTVSGCLRIEASQRLCADSVKMSWSIG